MAQKVTGSNKETDVINPYTGLEEDDIFPGSNPPVIDYSLSPQMQMPIVQQPIDQLDASQLLQRLYSKPRISPEAQQASELRRLVGGMLSVPRQRYDIGGGIVIGGETNRDLAEAKRLQDWAKEPIERAEKDTEFQRQQVTDLEKLQNLKSQEMSRKALEQQRTAQLEKTAEETRLKKALNDPSSDESLSEQDRVSKLLKMKADNLIVGAEINPQTGVARYPTVAKYANTLGALSDLVKGMSYNQLQNQLKNNDELFKEVSTILGHDIRRDLGGMQINLGGRRLEIDHGEGGRRRQDKIEEREIEGFPMKKGQLPAPLDYKNVSDAKTGYLSLIDDLDKLEELYKQHGSETQGFFGAGEEMGQTYASVFDRMRNLAKTGVLNKHDIPFVAKRLRNPVGIGAKGIEMISKNDYLDAIETVRQVAQRGMANYAKGHKYDDAPFRAAVGLPESDEYGRKAKGDEPSTKRTVIKKEYSPKLNKTRITYSDGPPEMVDGKQ